MKTKSTPFPPAAAGARRRLPPHAWAALPAGKPAAALLLAAVGALTLGGTAGADPAGPPATNGIPAALPPLLPPPPTTDTDAWSTLVIPAPTGVGRPAGNASVRTASPGVAVNAALEGHTRGKIIEKFHAERLDLRTALAMFATQNELNIVPDNNVTGTVTLDVHNLPLDQMMRALLEGADCSWQEEDGLIRVRNTETRTFVVDYLRLKRAGTGTSSATLASSTASGGSVGGGGGGGGSSSGGGGGGSGGGGGGGGSSSSSAVTLTEDNSTDFWTELRTELGSLLTEDGKKTLAINKTAGIIEVTDRPSVLDKVEHYLNVTEEVINRQVDIEAKIYDVSLNGESQFGIDWQHVAEAYAGSLGFGTQTLPVAIGSASSGLGSSSISGVNTSIPTGIMATGNSLVFENMNSAAAVTALETQGKVQVVAAPRIRTMNNQTAVVKVGLELPFFSSSSITVPNSTGNLVTDNDTVTTVTVGTILSITPQISTDGWIAMDISPVLTALVADEVSPDGTTTAPELTDKQAYTVARVQNDTTVVLGGLIQTEKDASANQVPVLGSIPLLGKLFTGNYHASSKNELVIFVTPHIVEANEVSVKYMTPPEPAGKKTH